MTVSEMHIMFREYSQRAGMQQVLDIRSEQIDVYLNNAVRDLVMARIQVSIQDADSRSINTMVKTGQNNDFRTLFKVQTLNIISTLFAIDADEYLSGKLKSDGATWPITDALIYYDYHVNYCTVTGGWTKAGAKPTKSGDWVSEIRRVRLIEHNYLGTTLSDNILRPNIRNPIILTQSVNGSDIKQVVELYFGTFNANGTFANNLSPYQLRVGYYRQPANIHLGADINEPDVNCDLPGHLHTEVVQRAIQYYQIAHGAGAQPQQAQARQQ
jgi:hypothetical protein